MTIFRDKSSAIFRDSPQAADIQPPDRQPPAPPTSTNAYALIDNRDDHHHHDDDHEQHDGQHVHEDSLSDRALRNPQYGSITLTPSPPTMTKPHSDLARSLAKCNI